MPTISEETIRLMVQAEAQRAVSVATGLTGYDLEDGSKALVPVMTPLRNKLKRIGLGKGVKGAPTHEWEAITAFDSGRITGVSTEGAAPSRVTYATQRMKNIFKTLTIANDVTFDAEFMGVSLEGSSVSKRRAELLWQLMIVEERALLTWSQNLMPPALPLLTTATTGGSVAAATNWFQVTAVNANGESTPVSSAASIVTTGSTSTITLTIFTVPNATYYNVYGGTGSTQPANSAMYIVPSLSGVSHAPQPGYAASVALASGGSINSGEAIAPTIVQTLTAAMPSSGANPPTTNTAISAKDTGTGLTQMYDGFMAQAVLNTAGSQGAGSYLGQPGAASGVLALSDIDNALISMNQTAGADPTTIYAGAVVFKRITALMLAANILRMNVDSPEKLARVPVGQRAIEYINPITGTLLNIVADRYMPLDSLLIMSHELPYPIPNLSVGAAVLTNREYWSVDFAVTTSQYSFANYLNETPVAYYLGGTGLIRGIAPSY